jgi:hypothetical protein
VTRNASTYPPKWVNKFCDPCKLYHIHQREQVNFVTYTNSTTSIKQGVTVSKSLIHMGSLPRDISTPSTTWCWGHSGIPVHVNSVHPSTASICSPVTYSSIFMHVAQKNKGTTKVSSTFVTWGDQMRTTCIWRIHGPHVSMFAPGVRPSAPTSYKVRV